MSHVKTSWDGPTKRQDVVSSKRKPLRRQSAKEKSKRPSRKACIEAVRKRSNDYCEARLVGCTVLGCHVHEIIPRSQGGSITDPNNCLHVCWTCHRMIHGFPNTARKLGLLKDKK